MPSRTELAIILRLRDEASAALGRVRGQFSQFGSKVSKVSSALKAGTVAAGAFTAAVATVAAAGGMLFGAVAGLDAMDRKAAAVFGDSLPQIQAWAKANASAMGLTRTQAINAAAGLQDLLIPMGFTREAATAMTTDVIGLSGALAEWSAGKYNAAEVSEILAKAMLGEREQLKALGISISEADVVTRLAALGQDELTGAALQQARAIATQQLIFEKSTDAQRAFAEGGDSLTRVQAELKAAFGEAKEAALRAFGPSMVELARFLKAEVIPAVQDASVWIAENLPRAIAAARDGFDRARPFIMSFISGLEGLYHAARQAYEFIISNRPVLIATVTAIGIAVAAALGPGGLAVAAIVGVITLIGKLRDDWRGVAISILGYIQTLSDGITDFVNSVIDRFGDLIEFAVNPVIKAFGAIGIGDGAEVQIAAGGGLDRSNFAGDLIAQLTAERDAINAHAAAQAAAADHAKGREALLAREREINAANAARAAAAESGLASAAATTADAKGKAKAAEDAASEATKRFIEVVKGIEQDFLRDQISAYIDGGDTRLAVVKEEQEAMLREAHRLAWGIRQTFAVDAADALEMAMQSVIDKAAKLREEAEKLNQTGIDLARFESALGMGLSGQDALRIAQGEADRVLTPIEYLGQIVGAGASGEDALGIVRGFTGSEVTQNITVNVTDGSPAAIAAATQMAGMALADDIEAHGGLQ